ncbi:MAG: hypothetical protein U5K36_04895 [Roseovarius sp.]|nr:hypothetical protein [Roseovarius sp.]
MVNALSVPPILRVQRVQRRIEERGGDRQQRGELECRRPRLDDHQHAGKAHGDGRPAADARGLFQEDHEKTVMTSGEMKKIAVAWRSAMQPAPERGTCWR